jgi:biopolymer transport protein TolR
MAGGSNFGHDDEEITGINVTPLVDVMLVLLVIFMVTANYIAHQALSLELPKASTGSDAGTQNLNFIIDRDSKLYLDSQAISFEKLPYIINDALKEKKSLQALISADRSTPHGSVIKLMDIIKKSGIKEIAFNVEFSPTEIQQE